MTPGRVRPPRLARLWLGLVLPPTEREAYLGDLNEGFADRLATCQRGAAQRWYWREAWQAPTRWTRGAVPSAAHPERAARGAMWHRWASDLRTTVRRLRRNPGSSALAVLTLALGIGANAAIFAVLNVALFRPLPVRNAHELVIVREVRQTNASRDAGASFLTFLDWQKQASSFSSMSIVGFQTATARIDGRPTRTEGLVVSREFFRTVGLDAARGSTLDQADDRGRLPNGRLAVMLSHSGWVSLFGGRQDVVGQVLTFDDDAAEIVGVTPAGLFPVADEPIDFWAPASVLGSATDPQSANASRNYRGYAGVVARLAPGVELRQAEAEMRGIHSGLAAAYPKIAAGREIALERLRDVFVTAPVRSTLWLLLALVGAVLLIACANVANLLLARAAARQRDVAVRTALGASTADVVRLGLMEGLVLAVAGGGLGVMTGTWVASVLASILPAGVPRPSDLSLDWRVFSFGLALSVAAGLTAGLAPALMARRGTTAGALASGGRSSTAARTRRVGDALVALEVSVSVVVLVAAGLLVNGLIRLHLVEPGFDVGNTLTVRLALDEARYGGPMTPPDRINSFLDRLRARLEPLPGVTHVAFAQSVPLTGSENSTRFEIDGQPAPDDSQSAQLRFVSESYFETLGVPVTGGRVFTTGDTPAAAPVAIVNGAFARLYFDGRNAIGQRLRMGWGGEAPKTIVGVVGDVRHRGMDDAPRPEMYVPQAQFGNSSITVMVRGSRPDAGRRAAILTAIRAVDGNLPLPEPKPLEDYRRDTFAVPRFSTSLVLAFGFVALALTLAGLYGVTSYGVSQRTREIGIRIAFGARLADIWWLVVSQAFRPVAVGLAGGGVAAYAAARAIQGWVFEVGPADPLTYGGVMALVTVVTTLACTVPARRAARVNPLVALRQE